MEAASILSTRSWWTLMCTLSLMMLCVPQPILAKKAGCAKGIGTDLKGASYVYERRAFGYGFGARALMRKKDYEGAAASSTTSAHIYRDAVACYVSLGQCDSADSDVKGATSAAEFAQKMANKTVKSRKGAAKATKSAKTARKYVVEATKFASTCVKATDAPTASKKSS